MMNTSIDAATPVGRIARHYTTTVPLFEGMDIEFACKGGRALRDAAVAAGRPPEEVLGAVLATIGGTAPAEEGSLSELIETLIADHQRFGEARFREMLIRLDRIDRYPDAERLHHLLKSIRTKLANHMLREEREIFPRIEECAINVERLRPGITRPILVEFVEHEVIHEWFAKVRELTLRLRRLDVDPALLDSIEDLDHAIHRHLHLENNVLIPRVIELEQRLKADRVDRQVTEVR